MKTSYINPFPLPETISKENDKAISALVKTFITENTGQARTEEILRHESDINSMVYNLYGLDSTEVELIEQAI